MSMDYIYIDRTNKITDEDIISDVLRVKNEVLKSNSLTMRDYSRFGEYGKIAVINHFGSWNNLLESLGLFLMLIYNLS